MHHSGVGDFGIFETQQFELTQSLEMHQPGIRDLGVVKQQLFELTQPLEMNQTGVSHRAFRKGH